MIDLAILAARGDACVVMNNAPHLREAPKRAGVLLRWVCPPLLLGPRRRSAGGQSLLLASAEAYAAALRAVPLPSAEALALLLAREFWRGSYARHAAAGLLVPPAGVLPSEVTSAYDAVSVIGHNLAAGGWEVAPRNGPRRRVARGLRGARSWLRACRIVERSLRMQGVLGAAAGKVRA